MTSLYNTMMINKKCSEYALHKRYDELLWHYSPGSEAVCSKKYFKVVKAFEILQNKKTRAFYDVCGGAGLGLIDEPSKCHFYTHILNRSNINIITIGILLIILNLAFLPISFNLHADNILSYTIIFFPTILALILVGLFVCKCFVYLAKNYSGGLKNEIRCTRNVGIACFFALIQMVVMCCVVDLHIQRFRFLWLLPYLIYEIVDYNFLTDTKDNKWNRIVRFLLVMMFVVPFDVRFKLILLPLLLINEMIAWRCSLQNIFVGTIGMSAFVAGAFICIQPPCPWVALFLGGLYVIGGIASVVMMKKVRSSYEPECTYGDKHLIDYDI